ncbi:hypothetical protein NBRC116494_06500 [Aurantivibrio plasticivorans]
MYKAVSRKIKKIASELDSSGDLNKCVDLEDVVFELSYEIGAKYYYEHNFLDAVRWLLFAAENNSIAAQSMLGAIYYTGNDVFESSGIEQDLVLAKKWLSLAAREIDEKACHYLGLMYYSGEGVSLDYDKAFQYFLTAAKKGHSISMVFLGKMYANGQGTNKNYLEAYAWLNIDADYSRNFANLEMDILETSLVDDKLMEAVSLCRKYSSAYNKP